MASIEAPIGASVIDYIQRNNKHETPTATDNGPSAGLEEEISTQTIPSLIPTHKSSNMILCGPCKSGRSSIVMNMAHSLAASHGDHCRSGYCGSASCCCPGVVILTPLMEGKHERFPLSCHVVEEPLPLDFYGQLRALQQSNHAEPNKTTSWNIAALRRIQVHRMSSIRNIMDFLLSFQGRNANPMSVIIIEDLDIFVRGDASCGDLTTEQLMLMTQTPNTVRRSQTASFSVLATMTLGVPWNVQRLWSTWYTMSLKICSPSDWKVPLEEDESVESSFVLQQIQQRDGGKERPETCVAHYAIVRQSNGSFRIIWKRGEE